MKITRLRIRQVTGTIESSQPFWENRQVRPVDIYPEYAAEPYLEGGVQVDETHFRLTQHYLYIETDEGIEGIAGPVWSDVSRLILSQLSPRLIGQDPIATELLWDQLHRLQIHGRQGDAMLALSAVDCALWDLKARWFGVPMWRLLGGKTRSKVPAYASMLGLEVEDLGLVRERALWYRDQGFTAQKWFLRHGPMAGFEGMKKNVELVQTLRETLGDGYGIAIDCWQSLSYDYAVEFCSRIEDFGLAWLEEPFMPDRIDTHVKLKKKTRIPLAGAEHEYTRWGMRRFTDVNALDILQPDMYWCGGVSECLKIAALATAHDLTIVPHGHCTPVGIHFTAAQSPFHTPMIEYLVKWNEINMHFLQTPPWPQNGSIPVPEGVGIGMDLNEDLIESERDLSLH
ncbi:enolase C-terminal domain-like protein [uncultured Cohaesibacter sp.]|uniref:enolase C-terminal domain-like protein n=1 Tax=uncultured Cohaesibacter sp. TaxID=1002546 RepID=UPI0029C62127|nr:enolase C-terminal domain-like protein [uncultured Cohaesibacter sp.]